MDLQDMTDDQLADLIMDTGQDFETRYAAAAELEERRFAPYEPCGNFERNRSAIIPM